MEEDRLVIRIKEKEKALLKGAASKFGYNLSSYIRYKLLEENEDLIDSGEKYISPPNSKHNLITVSLLLKIFDMQRELLKSQQNITNERFIEVEKSSLTYARNEREKIGYKHIKRDDE